MLQCTPYDARELRRQNRPNSKLKCNTNTAPPSDRMLCTDPRLRALTFLTLTHSPTYSLARSPCSRLFQARTTWQRNLATQDKMTRALLLLLLGLCTPVAASHVDSLSPPLSPAPPPPPPPPLAPWVRQNDSLQPPPSPPLAPFADEPCTNSTQEDRCKVTLKIEARLLPPP